MTESWLPPQAPGGRPPPRFDMVLPGPAEPEAAAPEPIMSPFEPAPAAPAATTRTPAPQTRGLALTAVILGAIGIGLAVVTAGLGFLLSLPCSVGAWVCGARARESFAPGAPGRGQAQAGYVLGVIGVMITVAALVAWIIWLASGGDFDQLQRDLERWRDEQTRQAAVHTARALFAR